MEVWTLGHIADAIMNNVTDGLHGNVNSPIPQEQIRSEILLMRNSMIVEQLKKEKSVCSRLPEFSDMDQGIGCLEVVPGHTSDCCEPQEGDDMPMVRIPQVLSVGDTPLISWLGPSDRRGFGWKIYYGQGHQNKQFLPSAQRPYGVLYPPKGGFQALYLYNLPYGTTRVSTTAVHANPYDVYEYACCSLPSGGIPEDTVQLPAPHAMIQQIIAALSQQYITYYRQMNIPILPNDQTDKTT